MTDTVGIRLGVQGAEAVTAKLMEMARSGELALVKLGDAAQDASRKTKDLESAANVAGGGFGSMATKALAAAAAAAAGFLALDKFKDASEAVKRVENALTASGVPADQLSQKFTELYEIAQRNSVPLEALTQLYGRLSQAQQSLGVSSQQISGLTEIVAKSLRVSGQSADQASGALLQLGQALGGGKIQAEEYNSLLDGMYPLLRAAAAGLKEAEGDVAKLTAMVKEGEISSKAFFAAIEAGSPILDDQLASSQKTVKQAQEEMNNAFMNAARVFSEMTGAGDTLADTISWLASKMDGAARSAAGLVNGITSAIRAIREYNAAEAEGSGGKEGLAAKRLRTQRYNDALKATRPPEAIQAAIENESNEVMRADLESTNGPFGPRAYLGPLPTRRPKPGREVNPISKNDPRFRNEEDDEEGGGGRGGGRKAGASKERANAYEREVAAINKRTAALTTERSLVGASAIESERLKTAIQLETAAKEANIPITDDMRLQIGRLAEAYARAKVELDETKDIFKAQNDLMRTVGQGVSGYISDIASGGENAQKALMNLSKRMSDLAIQAVLMGEGPLGKLFGLQGQNGSVGGIMGFLGSGLRGLFGGGASAAPAGMPLNIMPTGFSSGIDRVPGDGMYRLHRGEMVVPAFDSALLRPLISMASDNRRGGGNGGVVVNNYGSPEQVSVKQDASGVTIVDVMDQTNARGAGQAMRGRGPFAGLMDHRVAAQARVG